MKRYTILCAVLFLILSLSACSCDIDWSKFDLTKKNFGLTEEKINSVSFTDSDSDISETPESIEYSEEIINYIVPESSNVVYSNWEIVSSDNFFNMAKEKVLEMANLTAEIISLKAELSEYTSVSRMSLNETFSKTLNNIRAWSFASKAYPSDGLSKKETQILEALVSLGNDSTEYGSKLPSLILTNNTEAIGTYEDMIISQIVDINKMVTSGKN